MVGKRLGVAEMMATEFLPPEILAAFWPSTDTCRIHPLGGGNINDTFLLIGRSRRLVIQRIADNVFSNPKVVIDNFVHVSSHLRRKSGLERLPFLVAEPRNSVIGETAVRDRHGGWWRAQSYLEHRPVTLQEPLQARRVGRTLAVFHYLAADLDCRHLVDPLPGFHDLEGYLRQFEAASATTAETMDQAERFCVDTIAQLRGMSSLFRVAQEQAVVQAQLIHGDPKLENFIGDADGLACGLFDLDTVRLGLVHHDLGDCLRSACNAAGEEGDSQPVFDEAACREILAGYFSLAEAAWTLPQRELIYDGVLLICFELGMRFFTDYLSGNTYFKVRDRRQNLRRAVKQLQLVSQMRQDERRLRKLMLAASDPGYNSDEARTRRRKTH